VDGGVAAFVTTGVGTDVELSDPSALVAVTTTRSVFSRSTGLSTYSLLVAPLIDEQLPPFWSQRRHWYANAVGLFVHRPTFATSVTPTSALPEIVGGSWFAGRAELAAEPSVAAPRVAAATAVRAAAAATARTLFLVVNLIG
jgi:hypothetical protein